MKIFSLFQKKQTERIRFGQAVHPPSSKTKWQKHLTCSRRKKQGRGGQKQGRHAWPKFQIFHPLTKAKKKNYGAQDEGNSCSKMKFPKNWNNFSERCQENRKEKESTCVPPTERNHFHQTYDQPSSGGIVRRKNIGISSKVKPPYKKNKQQHGPLRRAVQTHIRQHCSRYTINS